VAELKPQPRNPRQVFLSHAHEDADFAKRLAADLREAGLSVWMTPDSIQPGESWVSAIDRGLSESGLFIVVLTPNAVRSPWVKKETQWALQAEQNKLVRLLPLHIQRCDVAQLSSLLTVAQYIDFEPGYDAGAIALFRALGLQHKAEREQLRLQAEAAAQAKRQREAAAEYARLRAAEERNRQLQAEPVQAAPLPNNPNPAPMPVATPVATPAGKAGLSRRALLLGLGLAGGGIGAAWLASRGAATPASPEPTTLVPTPETRPTALPSAPTAAAASEVATPANALALALAPGVTVPLVRVPAGEFWMGSDKSKDALTQDDEQPAHIVVLSEYAIGKFEVTVAQFAAFAAASGYKTTAEQQGSAFVSALPPS
jgi:hypothetical protein